MFLTLPESGLKVKLWVEFTTHERRTGTHRDTTVKVLAMRDAGESPEYLQEKNFMQAFAGAWTLSATSDIGECPNRNLSLDVRDEILKSLKEMG